MNERARFGIVCTVALLAWASPARAEEHEPGSRIQAFEVVAAVGAVAPVGQLAPRTEIGSVIGPGVAISAGFGDRIVPRLGLLLTSEFDACSPQAETPSIKGVHGFAVRGLVAYYPAPLGRFEPRATFGLGYRVVWESSAAGTIVTHGPEIARLETAVEVRLGRVLAVGPFASADLNLFAWQSAPDGEAGAMDRTVVNLFLSAGLGGRFDFPTSDEGRWQVAATSSELP